MSNQQINTGGPAFPTDSENQCGPSTWHHEGMSLLDYFAAKAMQADLTGQISHYGQDDHWPVDQMASHAYDIAAAMLKAREAALKGGAA